MPVGARNLELAMATVCCVLRPGFPSGGDRPLVGCAVGGAGDLPPRCGARCQLRRVHCWLAPPLHAQRMIFVPFAVAPPVASRHRPDWPPTIAPSRWPPPPVEYPVATILAWTASSVAVDG